MHLFVRSQSPRAQRRAFAIALFLPLLPVAASAQDSAGAKAPGIYNEEQAQRGNGIFAKTCVECHTQKDMSGADFRLNWNGRTVFDLFERIRTTMPEAAPGSMTRAEYADVTAYLLKLNGMPSGTATMPADSTLAATKIDIPAPPSLLVSRAGMLLRLPTPAHGAMLSGSRPTAPHASARSSVPPSVRSNVRAAHSTSSR